jgi:mRNA degradation ribonuclease J1/J2
MQVEYIDPQPTTERIRFIPIGGLGEVGKNMAIVEYGEDIVIVDVGMGFPEEEMFASGASASPTRTRTI